MDKDLTCQQVIALMNFYIEGKLNPKLSECIAKHLENCPSCRKKIEELTSIYRSYKNKENSSNIKDSETFLDKVFLTNLSAYVDNELNLNENIRIKKIAITNPNARKELETMYKFQQMLKNSFEKTKNDFKMDYSKNILSKIYENSEYTTSYFYRIGIIFLALVISIVCCFVYLYF